MVRPNRSSAKFTSVVGNLDQRVELDKRISYGNRKYNASLSIMASKLSYENEAFVKTIIKDHWNVSITDMAKQILLDSTLVIYDGMAMMMMINVSFFFSFIFAQMEFLYFDNYWNGKHQPILYSNP